MKNFKLYIAVLILALASVTTFVVPEVSAQESSNTISQCDESFFSSNDVLFYNPCATSCSASANGATGTVSQLKGQNNGEKIFNFWVDAGLSAQQAAGITGSMKHEAGFSPFRQEESQSWPKGGWGIAQFTGSQRDKATAFVKEDIGDELFNQYYKSTYGGAVIESNGFIPKSIPIDVNDKFLLGELNYLLSVTKNFKPSTNSIRTGGLSRDYNQTVPTDATLYEYLKSVVQAGDVAIAWTYLYESPANVKETSADRSDSANTIMSLYSKGISTSCGGDLTTGGMTLEQAIAFMKSYTSNPSNDKFIGGAARTCPGGPLSNCVSFSVYFINKYTSIKGFVSGSTGNGGQVVANIIARNPSIENGHSPRPYAIFSTASGSQYCGAVKCGHTGVILGVDTTRGKVIVGEAGCGNAANWDTAREYELSQFDSEEYNYVYTDGLLKGSIQ